MITFQSPYSQEKGKRMDNSLKSQVPAVIRRAVFDIGSLTTKMIVADVDTEQNRIIKILLKDTRQVGYKNHIERPHGDKRVTSDFVQKGIGALSELKAEAEALQPAPQEYAAVATASLRSARNSDDVIKAIEGHLKIPVSMISQEEEARLGFEGAVAQTGVDPDKALVWDTGGGSMQMITRSPKGKLETYGNELGFIPFTHQVIKTIQNKQIMDDASPNPLSAHQAQQAVQMAADFTEEIPLFVQEKSADPSTTVIAIGALYYATHGSHETRLPEKGEDTFTRDQIEHMLRAGINKTDQELIKATHPAIPVTVHCTSLVLILGFMRGLRLKEILTAEVNMTNGLLLESRYFLKGSGSEIVCEKSECS